MPEFLRTDRGGDYISNALALGLVRLDVSHQFTEAYSSFQNGRVERLHQTIDTKFAPTQVGHIDGGEDEYTKRVRRTVIPDTGLITLATLDTNFAKWVEEYNNTPHSALKGQTPYEAWFGDPHPIRTADRQTIAYALMRSKTLRLQKYGLDFRGRVYSDPKLGVLFDQEVETVEARYYAHDESMVEVFLHGEWMCTATDTRKQPDSEKAGIVSHRRAQTKKAARLAAEANYQIALKQQEDLRRRNVPESEWPRLPSRPSDKDDSDRSDQSPEARGGWQSSVTAAELNTLISDAS